MPGPQEVLNDTAPCVLCAIDSATTWTGRLKFFFRTKEKDIEMPILESDFVFKPNLKQLFEPFPPESFHFR